MNMLGPIDPTLDDVIRWVRHIRDNDLDFLTVDTVQAYANCSAEMAHEALAVSMGAAWMALKL